MRPAANVKMQASIGNIITPAIRNAGANDCGTVYRMAAMRKLDEMQREIFVRLSQTRKRAVFNSMKDEADPDMTHATITVVKDMSNPEACAKAGTLLRHEVKDRMMQPLSPLKKFSARSGIRHVMSMLRADVPANITGRRQYSGMFSSPNGLIATDEKVANIQAQYEPSEIIPNTNMALPGSSRCSS